MGYSAIWPASCKFDCNTAGDVYRLATMQSNSKETNMPSLAQGLRIATLTSVLAYASGAAAYPINDTYYGGNDHGYGDIVGGAEFDVNGASISRSGTQLTVNIFTNLAGHADEFLFPEYTQRVASTLNGRSMGIGYGDLFLASEWTPFGSDAHHLDDNNVTGTHWTYGFSIDGDRWTDAGGTGTFYALTGASNDANALLSNDFLSGAIFRDGQEVGVDRASNTVQAIGHGTWSVDSTPGSGHLTFIFDVGNTELAHSPDIALHWAMSCANDTIEGQQYVPEPGTLALMLPALFALRRRSGR